jgi:glucose-6-phosphate isomerase
MQAQAQALAQGRTHPETLAQLKQDGLSAELANQLATHRSFAGNVPSSTLWLAQLTPFALGALLALYEHKVFCQAAIWGINAYDQWGVELGKTMALAIEKDKPKPPG